MKQMEGMILSEMEGMKLVHDAHDDHTVTARTLPSTAGAQLPHVGTDSFP